MKIDCKKLNMVIAEKGMMLKDVATASGLNVNSFRAIRTGQAQPRLATIGRIANALGVGVQVIVESEEGK